MTSSLLSLTMCLPIKCEQGQIEINTTVQRFTHISVKTITPLNTIFASATSSNNWICTNPIWLLHFVWWMPSSTQHTKSCYTASTHAHKHTFKHASTKIRSFVQISPCFSSIYYIITFLNTSKLCSFCFYYFPYNSYGTLLGAQCHVTFNWFCLLL